jgi:hypothetical protein
LISRFYLIIHKLSFMKTRQKAISSAIIISLFVLLLPTAALAQTNISFDPDSITAETGGVFNVDMSAISDSDTLYSGDIYLSYDKDILDIMQPELSVAMGACDSTSSLPWSGVGERDEGARVWFGRGSCDPVDISSNTRILTLRFTASTTGSTVIELKQDVEWGLYSDSSTSIATSAITVGSFSVEVLNDTDPPTVSNPSPAGIIPSGTVSTTMSVETDENATCRYNPGVDTDYSNMSDFDITGSMIHETPLTGLSDGQSYNYFVRCQDGASNTNASGYEVAFSVEAPTPTVLIEPDPATVTEGDQVTVTLTVADAMDLGGVMADIAYDTSYLAFDLMSVTAGTDTDSAGWEMIDVMEDPMMPGIVSIMADSGIGSALEGDVTIVNFSFDTLQPGTSDLQFQGMMDSLSRWSDPMAEITANWDDGRIMVEELDETAPEVVIIDPASDSTYTYNSASSDITLSGTSTDNTAVDYLEWENSATAATGTVTGTSSWSVDIGLNEGENPVTVTAYDPAGNSASTSINITYKRAPAISGVRASGIGTSIASISWTTDINATSQVEYGTSQSLGSQTSVNANMTTEHSIGLSGLNDGTTYHYLVISEAVTGATAMSAIRTFTTDSASSGSSGGGGGSSYTPPLTDDEQPYEQPSSVRSEVSGEAITISWINPDGTEFEKTIVIRSTEQISDYMTYEAVSGMGDIVYEGTGESFADNNISPNLDYYYAVFSMNKSKDYSEPVVMQKSAVAKALNQDSDNNDNSTGSNTRDYGNLRNLANVDSGVVNQVSRREAAEVAGYNRQVPLDGTTLPLYELIVSRRKSDLAQKEKYAVAYYIHYGTQTTKWLGAGERTGVVNSYRSAFGKLPRTDAEWQDVIKIANGRWPDERSQAAESNAKTNYFVAVYKRQPDMKNANDNAAVTVIAYGLRPADRNMDSETQAIKIFRTVYGYTPESAIDWDIVRSIAYSGAVR